MLAELLASLATPSLHIGDNGIYEKVQWDNGTETVGSPLNYADLILDTIIYSAQMSGIVEISLHSAVDDTCLICWIRNENGFFERS